MRNCFGRNSPSAPLQDAPVGAKVFSQGREPLGPVPHWLVSPSGATDAPERMRSSVAPSGLIGLGDFYQGLAPLATYLRPFGA